MVHPKTNNQGTYPPQTSLLTGKFLSISMQVIQVPEKLISAIIYSFPLKYYFSNKISGFPKLEWTPDQFQEFPYDKTA